MEAVYPATASALSRGRRPHPSVTRHRHRTLPVTFAEIKELDEENQHWEENETSEAGEARRRRPDLLDERLGRQFIEFRRRRARRGARGETLRELDPEPERAGSEPAAQSAEPPPYRGT